MTSATLAPTRTPAGVRIRRFTNEDYPAIVAIENLRFPDYADTVEQVRFHDEKRDAKILWNRFLAEDESGNVLGCCSYNQSEDMYHPRKFNVGVCLRPEHEGKGIGTALYDTLLEAIAPYDPILLRTNVREDYARSMTFVRKRGYEEEQRDWESRIDPRAIDFSRWADALPKAEAGGITIKSYAELADDRDRDRKLYELDWAVTLDMPSPDTLTEPGFDHFQKKVLENPDFIPTAWFVALDGDRYVGESALWRSSVDDSLYTGATGVLREYRRRGIATALKIRALSHAASIGCPLVKTWNAQSNRAMLSINEALGFEKQPAWISFGLKLKEETE
jgi:mycothiol synthase